MKKTLQDISELTIQVNETCFTSEQIAQKWLGTRPASMEDILTAERRLNIQLPADYKEFLLITDGFFTPENTTEPTFEKI